MTGDNNPYQAPESVLSETSEAVGGSLEKGISGDYDFSIGSVISDAAGLLKGFKRTYWGAVLILIVANVVFSAAGVPFQDNLPVSIIIQIASLFVVYPLTAGLVMLGVYRVAGRDVQAMQVTAYFSQTLKIVLLNILMILLVLLGFLLLVLPGIYLSIAYMFAIPLMLDKKLGIWEALEASRKTITHKWFGFLGLILVIFLMLCVAAIPLGIGLIWVLPLVGLVVGVAYVQILGAESE